MAAEIEFFDISLTKDSSLCPMLFTVPSTGGFLRTLSGFNNPYKKIRETRKL
jgi:hypothetical protein